MQRRPACAMDAELTSRSDHERVRNCCPLDPRFEPPPFNRRTFRNVGIQIFGSTVVVRSWRQGETTSTLLIRRHSVDLRRWNPERKPLLPAPAHPRHVDLDAMGDDKMSGPLRQPLGHMVDEMKLRPTDGTWCGSEQSCRERASPDANRLRPKSEGVTARTTSSRVHRPLDDSGEPDRPHETDHPSRTDRGRLVPTGIDPAP